MACMEEKFVINMLNMAWTHGAVFWYLYEELWRMRGCTLLDHKDEDERG